MADRPSRADMDVFLDVVTKVLRGDMSARMPIEGAPDEWAAVCAGFNLTVEELGNRIEELRSLNEEHTRINAELRRTQGALRRTEKTAVLGRLSASIGHEINNPAAALTLALPLIQESVEAHVRSQGASTAQRFFDELSADLQNCREASERIRDIATSMRAFGRPDESPAARLKIDEVARAALTLVASDLRRRVQVVDELEPTRAIVGQRGALIQVVINLLVNAADAAEDTDDKLVRVWTKERDGHVVCGVVDSGAGVPSELREAIFEPFYSTKSDGRSLGLGLAISADTAARHGGRIETREGEESTFELLLPFDTGLATSEVKAPTPHEGRRVLSFLVVEDEPLIAKMLRKVLEQRGHQVTVFDNAPDIIAALEAGVAADAVLCDLVMPDTNGTAVVEHIERTRPELASATRILTGGAVTAELDAFVREREGQVLLKPFKMERLVEVVRELELMDET